MHLYLIRHPAPQVATGICYGSTDLPLAGSASAAADRIRPQLPEGIAIFTSPLQRCRQLAEALHPAPRHDARLQEMHFGDWEMQTWQAIPRSELDRWANDPLGFCPPNGESVAQFRQRVLTFIAELHSERITHAALVAHAGVLKVLVGAIRSLPTKEWMALHFDYEYVLEVTV